MIRYTDTVKVQGHQFPETHQVLARVSLPATYRLFSARSAGVTPRTDNRFPLLRFRLPPPYEYQLASNAFGWNTVGLAADVGRLLELLTHAAPPEFQGKERFG
jgi:hypothetical protein